MKKIILSLFAAFLLLLTAGNCYSQMTDSILAQKFVSLNAAGKFDEARTMFAPAVQPKLPEGILANVWNSLVQKYGKFQKVSSMSMMQKDTFNIFLPVCNFEKASLTLTLPFSPSHLLYGFRITGVKEKKSSRALPNTISVDTSIQVNGGHIAGTLLMPDKKDKIPVALIIAGSGPTNRNGNNTLGEESNAYLMMADSLAVHGIASFRYDKRGVGMSNDFNQPEAQLRFDDFVNDAIDLILFLEKDSHFFNVIIIGHSEGSLIGMLAAEKTKAGAYISLSGAGEPAGKILQWQLSQQPGIDKARIKGILDSVRKAIIVKDVPAGLQFLFRPSVQPYITSWMKYDPSEEIKKLTIPILIVNGTTDLQVNVKQAEMLHHAKPNAQLALIRRMNHILKNAPADRKGNFATYKDPNLPLNATLVKIVVHFIKSIPSHNHS